MSSHTIVKDHVRERRLRTRDMFVPLVHPPGHGECDFGEAWAVISVVKRRVHPFVLDLAHSDAMFVTAYPADTTEVLRDGVAGGLNTATVFSEAVSCWSSADDETKSYVDARYAEMNQSMISRTL